MRLGGRTHLVVMMLFCCVLPSVQGQRGTEGLVRLRRGIDSNSGYLEIFHDGRWGRVCDTDWDFSNAYVVCKQLGYMGAVFPVEDFPDPPPPDPPLILDEVQCTGQERRLANCPRGDWGELESGCQTAMVHCIPFEIPTEEAAATTDFYTTPDTGPDPPPIRTDQPTPSTAATDNTVIYAVIAVLILVLLVVVAVFVLCVMRRRMTRDTEQSGVDMGSPEYMSTQNSVDQELGGNADIYEDVGLPSWAARWEILQSNLIVDDKILGRGDFGEVRSGTVIKGGSRITSAVKILKDQASAEEKVGFLEEFRTMTSIGHHPNVVSLLGACQHQDVLYVALEYLPNGDLRSYLRRARSSQTGSRKATLTSGRLVQFAFDVAKGMKHLAMSGVIHRDLAARNVLLGEGLVAKVSDFGLSRGEDIYVQASKGMVPTRWLAIESLTHKTYTTQSDVWSFGILLWEIATLGGTPYPSIDTRNLAGKLAKGYRMGKPSNCGDKIYALMLRCWDAEPKKRPSFADLIMVFGKMIKSKGQQAYFVLEGLKHYDNLCVIRPELEDNY